MKYYIWFISLLCPFIVTIANAEENKDIYLYSKDTAPHDIAYERWPIIYWQKIMAGPENETTNYVKDCYAIQHGSVMFLANPFGIPKANYECFFNTENSFFFPLYSEECDYESIKNDDGLRSCVTENNQYAKGKIFIDGVEIKDIKEYKITTDFFNINFSSISPFGVMPGTYRALIDGLFLFFKPLPAGIHEIKYSIIQIKPTHDNDYASEITYKLHINPK